MLAALRSEQTERVASLQMGPELLFPHYGVTPSRKGNGWEEKTVKSACPMRKSTTATSWKRAMLHAWLGFILLLAFYVLTFGVPDSSRKPIDEGASEQVFEEQEKDPVVLTGWRE